MSARAQVAFGQSRPSGTKQSAQPLSKARAAHRRFLIWGLMAGFIQPERVVERVVAEIEAGI